MCELFAISSKLPTKVTFSLEEFASHGGIKAHHTDGWGLAFYDGSFAQIFHEAEPSAYSEWMSFLQKHQTPTRRMISHIRHATVGECSLKNTQPFSRELGGKRHVFCHNGNLENIHSKLKLDRFKPIGETDSEYAFCYLMSALTNAWSNSSPKLNTRIEIIKSIFNQFSKMGPANFLYSDSDYLYAYANKRTQPNGTMKSPGLYYLNRQCKSQTSNKSISSVDINDENIELGATQKIILFASVPLSNENWIPFESNQLIVSNNGEILHTII